MTKKEKIVYCQKRHRIHGLTDRTLDQTGRFYVIFTPYEQSFTSVSFIRVNLNFRVE